MLIWIRLSQSASVSLECGFSLNQRVRSTPMCCQATYTAQSDIWEQPVFSVLALYHADSLARTCRQDTCDITITHTYTSLYIHTH